MEAIKFTECLLTHSSVWDTRRTVRVPEVNTGYVSYTNKNVIEQASTWGGGPDWAPAHFGFRERNMTFTTPVKIS